jgi:long-chain acyl-CoA synthetase
LKREGIESVAALFMRRVDETPDGAAFQYPTGDGWGSMAWREVGERVADIAYGLLELGIEREERCAILCNTRVEWILADFAILCAAGVTTTIYPSNTAEECHYILADSGATLVFAEDESQVAKLREVRAELPDLAAVVVIDGETSEDGWVMSLAEFEERGRARRAEDPQQLEKVVAGITRDQLATLIYTSGTTGQPKGVELIHDAWVFEACAIDDLGFMTIDDHQYLWLPLSHSFGKMLQVSQLATGYVTTVDGRIPKLVENLGEVRPTFMAAAPRIFEKVYNKVVSGAQESGGLKLAIFEWSMGVGREVSSERQAGRAPAGFLALKHRIADALVFSKLRARFGGRIRFFVSGAAPLAREMAEFFHAADILILEGYGLTESSAASFVNRPDDYAFGTVGAPLPGIDVRIEESDGEILIRGRGIMRGYRNRPDATAEALTSEGWLRTGDIGELDASGRLRITDRKKDLIKTSGGKYVAPQSLEGRLKSLCPYLSQVVVHGNNRNFCTALISLDEESMAGWKEEQGLGGLDYATLAEHEKVLALVSTAVDELNSGLARYETIKKFALLPADLAVETGELTASLKVKRKVVEERYRHLLDGFYDGALRTLTTP